MPQILVIAESAAQAQSLRFALAAEGFGVDVASNGQAGFERLSTVSFDLVITDVPMPGLTGYELARKIRMDPAHARLPIILLTKLSEPMDILQGLECGADAFFSKPFDAVALLQRVRQLLAPSAAPLGTGAEVVLLGRKVRIGAGKDSILDLLSASVETLVRRNHELEKSQAELHAAQGQVKELRVMESRLYQAQRMETVGLLAGGVAHDFNNILTIISGYSELLIASLPSNDPTRRMVQEISKAGERGALLTRQLLAFSRKQVIEPRVLDINEIVTGAEKMLRRLIGEDIDVATKLAANLAAVRVDPGQIEQVIMNLAANSRDAMPQGGKLTIETGAIVVDEATAPKYAGLEMGQYIMLAVADSGVGMDDDTKAHLFEPFFTTKQPGRGTGLGLATVHSIVKQSGGGIFVHSVLGQGTTVRIFLPVVKSPAAPSKSNLNLTPPPTGRETVLLVEDEPTVRAMTRIVLEMYGYQVLEAGHGEEAIRVVGERQTPIQLLVSDVVMPGMSGRQVVESLRPQYPAMKVLYLSGYTDDAVMRHGVLGADFAFLQKPFTPIALANKVREVLDAQ